MLFYKTTVCCVASCDFIKSTCWALCPSTNRESHVCRRLKSCVKWHLAAGCSTSVIMIQQPLYLTQWQLNLWPNVTNCRSHDCYLAKQGANVTGALQLRELSQQKSGVSFVKARLSHVFVSRDKQAVSATHRGTEDKTLMGCAPQITVALLTLRSYRGIISRGPEGQQQYLHTSDVTNLCRGQPLY